MIICASIKINYVPTNLKFLHTLRIKVAKKKNNLLLLTTFFAHIKKIVMTGKSVHRVSVFVTVVLKGITRPHAINQL